MTMHGERYSPTGSFRPKPPRFSWTPVIVLLILLIVVMAAVVIGPVR